MHLPNPTVRQLVVCLLIAIAAPISGQQQPVQFGGAYANLGARRQHLIDNWVARFVKTTGQRVEPGAFYDEVLSQSTKTTFDAVTHALTTTALTDGAGAALGDALALVAEVDSVKGEVTDAPGDRQFRMYVRLTADAYDRLQRSTQFKRGADNTTYHRGYPISFREQGGIPSIQFSITDDKQRADIDVDYRSSSFPAALFNGHLTSSNSDVRAGNNYNLHLNRWTGFQNWWGSFFGVRHERAADTPMASPLALPRAPRAGKGSIDEMVHDFLTAWLVEQNVVAAMGYVSERAYACLARDSDDPATFDRGVAPFQLMINLKAASDALGTQRSLDTLVVGTRLAVPAVRVVQQKHHARFVIYSVPDDVAAGLECESQLTLGDSKQARRVYGNYFGATFYVGGGPDTPVTLLWAKDQGYWKIVSWQTGADNDANSPAAPESSPAAARIPADPALAIAARAFLESWLIKHNYDSAFAQISPKAYGCYNLESGGREGTATSPDEAGRKLRAGLEAAGKMFGTSRSLDEMLTAPEPFHPAMRLLTHRDSRTFALISIPNALGDAVECAARAAGTVVPDPLPAEYGKAFLMTLRFKTRGGEPPLLKLLWRQENAGWRITSYGVEMP